MRRAKTLAIASAIALCVPGLAMAATTLTRTASFAYDATTGLITKEIVEPDTSALCAVTSYSYDTFGNKNSISVRNCNGTTGEAVAPTGDPVISARTTNTTFDARGQFATGTTNALSQTESRTYDPATGALLSLIGPNGLTTTWQYDGFGRKTRETRADGMGTKWEYLYCSGINGGTASCPIVGGAAGAWVLQETPLATDGVTQAGPISKVYFDGLNREIRKETQGFDGGGTPTAVYRDTQYDSLGRSYMVSRPYFAGQTAYWIVTAYDTIGRTIQETQPDNSTTTVAYNGLVTTITDAKGQATATTRNAEGKVVKVVDALNKAINYTYDPFGNLLTTTDPSGNVITLTYDLRGRKTQMKDPDMGTWNYAYDVLGQLVRQTDAKSQVSTMTYDLLGRLTKRSEPDLVSNWYFDTYKGGTACAKGIGKLCQAETSTGYNRTLTYDSLGRETGSATTIDAPTPYSAAATYDTNGRIQTRSYPSGLVVKHVYTTLGYLKELRDNATDALYWRADNLDAEGHFQQQTFGDGTVTQRTYDNATGRLAGILAGAGNVVQNLSYQYDVLGNMSNRADANQGLSESFVYDALNRLTSATVNSGGAGIVTTAYAYDNLGNITSKGDLGGYAYPASGATSVRPHAVSQITLTGGGKLTFTYDANGALLTQTQTDAANNTIAARGRSHTYTSFGMPLSLAQGSNTSTFAYGPEHQRVKQVSSVVGTTIYLNPGNEGALYYEKDVRPDNSVEQRSFISAGNVVVAVVKHITTGSGTTASVRYFHRDNLGSVSAVTNESGAVVERMAYEPFGKRRFPSGVTDPNNTIAGQNTDRGYTGHEMLDELALIHMNGRVYDPLIGRFVSADPFIQSPLSLQSYNRYSYVENNPLTSTDPSGYTRVKLLTWIFKPAQALFAQVSYRTGQAIAAFGSMFCGPYAYLCAAAMTYDNAVAHGRSQSQAIMAGFSAGAASFVGMVGNNWAGDIGAEFGEGGFAHFAAHAGVGCATSMISGGKCSSGAISAVGGLAGTQLSQGMSGPYGMAVSMVAGGTASVLSGGKFANGAVTAAYGYVYNCMEHGCGGAGGQGGSGPGDVGRQGVVQTMERYRSQGYEIVDVEVSANLPGVDYTRRYDFVTRSVETGAYIGVEVKASEIGIFRIDRQQGNFDAAVLVSDSGATVRNGSYRITGVKYEGIDLAGNINARWQQGVLYRRLQYMGAKPDVTVAPK